MKCIAISQSLRIQQDKQIWFLPLNESCKKRVNLTKEAGPVIFDRFFLSLIARNFPRVWTD